MTLHWQGKSGQNAIQLGWWEKRYEDIGCILPLENTRTITDHDIQNSSCVCHLYDSLRSGLLMVLNYILVTVVKTTEYKNISLLCVCFFKVASHWRASPHILNHAPPPTSHTVDKMFLVQNVATSH